MSMFITKKDKKVIMMVTHHNAVFEFMKLFKRKEHVSKKPGYCWTGAVDLEIPKTTLNAFIQKRNSTLNDLYLKNNLFHQITITDF